MWIDDNSEIEPKRVFIPITGDIDMIYGDDAVWGENGLWVGHEEYVTGDTSIGISPEITSDDPVTFLRINSGNHYEMRLNDSCEVGTIRKIVVYKATQINTHKYGEEILYKIGNSYAPSVYINIYYNDSVVSKQFTIMNARDVYIPYEFVEDMDHPGEYVCYDIEKVGANGIILYAEMRPTPNSGVVDYYKIPLSSVAENTPLFYIANKLLPLQENNMRVILHAMVNGSEVGHVEMQPVQRESDGCYLFEADMHPLNQLVDIDNRINIASVNVGGGSWVATNEGSVVGVDASKPELSISILVRSNDALRDSEISIGDSYTGFRIVDQYTLDDVDLVQEMKEMRSVVKFGDIGATPTYDQLKLYDNMQSLSKYDESVDGNIFTITEYAYRRLNNIKLDDEITFEQLNMISGSTKAVFESYVNEYKTVVSDDVSIFDDIIITLNQIIIDMTNGDSLDWDSIYHTLYEYPKTVDNSFKGISVDGDVEIQLVPFVEYSLMNSDRFDSFVSAFTQVHKAIEPVIMKRLEGNNYLDCKLIATYGLPHSYTSDLDYGKNDKSWPDLNIQIEFDVKLFNVALATNTINEIRTIVKSYFNRLTTIHTPTDAISMDNNIYVSHLIQQIESHANVAYLKFKGWYTDEKNEPDGNYLSPYVQAIVQKWKKLEDFPKEEMERFVPEMFVLEDKNIVINVIDN